VDENAGMLESPVKEMEGRVAENSEVVLITAVANKNESNRRVL
jgi:hypothetical protein